MFGVRLNRRFQMVWKLIGHAVQAYLAYSRAVDAICHDLKHRLQRELDIVGHVFMALPMLAIALWLLGVR